jgi:hypothetical protein
MNVILLRYALIVATLTLLTIRTSAQDLLDLLNEDSVPEKEFVTGAFKSTRVITGHSMEMTGAGVLDFRILHRFGRLNEGSYGAWGLDQATIRLGLDYGITRRLMTGIDRSSNKKQVDGFLKYRLIWQGKGKGSLPFSVILFTSAVRDGVKFSEPERKNFESSRWGFANQIIIGRKFSESFSLQIVPSMVHRNLVPSVDDAHDIYGVGTGMRLKLTRRIAFTAEYFFNLPDQLEPDKTDPLSLGFDIETGGHVFQLHFTNALGMNERSLITETDGSWDKGDIHFGFNISRVFTISKPKSFKANKS